MSLAPSLTALAIIVLIRPEEDVPRLRLAWAACPGRGIPYPELMKHFFPALATICWDPT